MYFCGICYKTTVRFVRLLRCQFVLSNYAPIPNLKEEKKKHLATKNFSIFSVHSYYISGKVKPIGPSAWIYTKHLYPSGFDRLRPSSYPAYLCTLSGRL
jgi:hypothetical protein